MGLALLHDLWDEAETTGMDEPEMLRYRSNLLGSDDPCAGAVPAYSSVEGAWRTPCSAVRASSIRSSLRSVV